MERLVAWARGCGGEWHPHLEVKHGTLRGRGVFAVEPIARGELLLKLPKALAVHPSDELAALVENNECNPFLALVLTALHEMHVSQDRSPYFAYFADSVPTDEHPLLWDAAAVGLLSGSLLPPNLTAVDVEAAMGAAFERDVMPVMERLGEVYLPCAARALPTFVRTLALCLSHALHGRVAFELDSASLWPALGVDAPDVAPPFLLPLFDRLNHSSNALERCTRLVTTGDTFEMRAERDVAAGEELLHSYGSQGSAELFRTYGFVEPCGSPHTTVMLRRSALVDAAIATDALSNSRHTHLSAGQQSMTRADAARRMAALERHHRLPAAFSLSMASGVPAPLLTAVQVLLMADEELEAWEEAGGIELGEAFLEEDTGVIACLLKLCAPRHPGAAAAVVGGCAPSSAASTVTLLRSEENAILKRVRAAVLMLACGAESEDSEESEEGEAEGGSGEEEEEDEDEEERGAAVGEEQGGRDFKRSRQR